MTATPEPETRALPDARVRAMVARVRTEAVDVHFPSKTLNKALDVVLCVLDKKATVAEMTRVKSKWSLGRVSQGLPQVLEDARKTVVSVRNRPGSTPTESLVCGCVQRCIQASDLEYSVIEENLGFCNMFLDHLRLAKPTETR